LDRPMPVAVENMLLARDHHCHRIAECWRRLLEFSPNVMKELILPRSPKKMVDCAMLAAIEDMLLVRHHHRRRIAEGRRRADTLSPLIVEELICRAVPENVVD